MANQLTVGVQFGTGLSNLVTANQLLTSIQEKGALVGKTLYQGFDMVDKGIADATTSMDKFQSGMLTGAMALKPYLSAQSAAWVDTFTGQVTKGITATKDCLNGVLGAKNAVTAVLDFGSELKDLGTKIWPAIQGVWSFTAALLANPITWIVVGVVALGAAIYLLWRNWDKVTQAFQFGLNWISGMFSKAPQWVQVALMAFMPFISLPLMIIKNWKGITGFFQNIGKAISNMMPPWLKDFFGLVGKGLGAIGNLFTGPKGTTPPTSKVKTNPRIGTKRPSQTGTKTGNSSSILQKQFNGSSLNKTPGRHKPGEINQSITSNNFNLQPDQTFPNNNRVSNATENSTVINNNIKAININVQGGKTNAETAAFIKKELDKYFKAQAAAVFG